MKPTEVVLLLILFLHEDVPLWSEVKRLSGGNKGVPWLSLLALRVAVIDLTIDRRRVVNLLWNLIIIPTFVILVEFVLEIDKSLAWPTWTALARAMLLFHGFIKFIV
jgi:hypothetical protein